MFYFIIMLWAFFNNEPAVALMAILGLLLE